MKKQATNAPPLPRDVLIVEDSSTQAMVLKRALEKNGWCVRELLFNVLGIYCVVLTGLVRRTTGKEKTMNAHAVQPHLDRRGFLKSAAGAGEPTKRPKSSLPRLLLPPRL